MKTSLLLALLSASLVAGTAIDSVSLCKQQILLSANPAQLCYGTLHANLPGTRTSTLTGPTNTTTATYTTTVSTIFSTVATVTAVTPTVTSTSTVESTTYTYTLEGKTGQRRAIDKRLLSLVGSFGQSLVDQVCFAIVYGGKTPTVTTDVPGPTITSTSTVLATATFNVTATVTPAASTTVSAYTDVQTSTVTYTQIFGNQYCTFEQPATSELSLDDCANLCANESSDGQCTTFGVSDMGISVCYFSS